MLIYKFQKGGRPRLPEPVKSDNTRIQMPTFEIDRQIGAAMQLREQERDIIRKEIKKSTSITSKEKASILMSTKKLDENAHLIYSEKNPHSMKAGKKESTGDRVRDVLENPLDAFQYAVSGGGIQNMPRNYSDMKHAGVVDPFTEKNIVGKALGAASYIHPVTGVIHGINTMRYTSKDIAKAAKTGEWEDIKNAGISAGLNLLDFTPAALVGRSGRLLNGATGTGIRTMQVASKLPGGNAVNSFIGNKLLPGLRKLDGGVSRSFEDTKISKFFPTVNPMSKRYNPIHRKTWNIASSTGRALDRRQALEVIAPSKKVKSEIDWENWVQDKSDFHENPDVIKHLNDIEKHTKDNGTWMKNQDGSEFSGTKEQFVIQQSDNFKKAFPDYYGQVLYHNSPNKFNFFDESKFGSTDRGFFGKGIYMSEDLARHRKPLGKKGTEYGNNHYDLYVNSKNPFVLKHNFFEDYNKIVKGDLKTDINSLYFKTGTNNKLDNHTTFTLRGLTGDGLYREEVVVPFSSPVKSALGNILLDMKNPNIYKAFTGVLGGSLLYNKKD